MRRWIKRLFVLALLGAGGGYAFRALRARRPAAAEPGLGPSTEWPPLERQTAPVKTGAVGLISSADDPASTASVGEDESLVAVSGWRAPVDGACPAGFAVKASGSSRIYHVPGGRFYDRTIPERCYESAEAAERDGYRRSKA